MKRVMYVALVIFLSILLTSCLKDENETIEDEAENNINSNEMEENDRGEQERHDTATPSKKLILEIYELAKEGKLYGANWIVGDVRADDIEEKWGTGDSVDEAAGGIYVTYKEEKIVFGKDKMGKVYDLRTYSDEIKQITERETIDLLGEPDELRHFGDENILVYKIDDLYELKFIFPPENDGQNDRFLSHVNLVYLPWAPANVGNFPIMEDVENLVNKMSLQEKIGQLIITGVKGLDIDEEIQSFIRENYVGGIILLGRNIESVDQLTKLTKNLKNMNLSHIPLFIGIDEEGGRITRLPDEVVPTPSKREIGTTKDPQLAHEVGTIIGEKLLTFGINMNFSPVLDIDSNPNNPVIGDRAYGSTPELVTRFGVEEMNGLKEAGVIPVIKHFPGHGDTDVDSHLQLPIVRHSKERMNSFELLPFIHAINNGADVVMAGHLLVPSYDEKNPASMSRTLIRELLRGELQFHGVVMTDDMTMGAIMENFDIREAAIQSIRAGVDLVLINHEYENTKRVIDAIMDAVQKGQIDEEQINQSVERILTLKKKYLLTDDTSYKVDVLEINNKTRDLLDKIK